MQIIFGPERLDIVISVEPETRALIDRGLALIEHRQDKKIAALTQRLKTAQEYLAGVVAAHPDPDPTD